MMSRTLGISRVVISMRAGIDRRPRIGPSTSPRNRSIEVHSAPKATWKNSSAQSLLAAIAAISAMNTAATMGSPRSGTIWKSGTRGRLGGARPAAGSATSAMARA